MALHFPKLTGRAVPQVRFIGVGLCLSFILFFFWHHPPASLLLLVMAAVLAYIRLEIAIALLPLCFPYYEYLLPLSPSGYPAFYLAELGLVICMGAMVLRHIFRPDERQATREWAMHLWQQARPFIPPALLLMLGASLGLLVSPDQHISLRAYREEIIEPLLYFLLILRYLRSYTDLARAIGALLLSALSIACMGIGQGYMHLTSLSEVLNATELRVSGPTPGPNNIAFLMDRAIPIVMALAFLEVLRHPTNGARAHQPPWREPLRWVCLLTMIPMVWALYWSDSRGAEVGILAVIVFFLAVEVRNRVALLVIGGVGIVGVVVFWSKIMTFINEPGHGSASERIYIWQAALLMIRDHFLLGTGPDSFNTLFRPTSPNSYLLRVYGGPVSAHFASLAHPHNFILDFWISAGLLGLGAIFWLLGAFAVVVVRTYRSCADLPQGGLIQRFLLGLAGCMLASIVHGLVDDFYFLPDLALTFWLFLGVLLVVRTIVQRHQASIHDQTNKQGKDAIAA